MKIRDRSYLAAMIAEKMAVVDIGGYRKNHRSNETGSIHAESQMIAYLRL